MTRCFCRVRFFFRVREYAPTRNYLTWYRWHRERHGAPL
jgi:hypothetical protein